MVKVVRFFFILTIFNLLLLHNVVADEVTQLEEEMKLRADFISLMLRVGDDIEKNSNISSDLFNRPEKMVTLLEEKMAVYESFYEKGLMIPLEKKEVFKKTFLAINWEKVIPLLKKAHIGVEIFFKRKGFGLGIAVLAGMLCEYLVPVTLIHVGLPHLIPFSMMTPWSTLYSFIPGYIQKNKIRNMLTETLGGKAQVLAYEKQQENVFKVLHMHNPHDLLYPVGEVDGMTKVVVIRSQTLKETFFRLLGYRKDALSLVTVKKFLSDNSISDPYLEWILENENMNKDIKVGVISSHILSVGSPDVVENFQKIFSESILTLKNESNWEESWNWLQEMKKATSLNELFKKIKETPTNMNPKEVAIIWEEMLLPEYAVKFNLNYSESRRMYDQFNVLKAQLNTTNSLTIDTKTKNDIYFYLKKISAGKSFGGCKNSPLQVEKFLLSTLH